MSFRSLPEIGWVIHDSSGRMARQCRKWSLRCGFQSHQIYVINNSGDSQGVGEMRGNNSAFEFSGYALALDMMKGNGPFVLVNDTLFCHHWNLSWRFMLQRLLADSWLYARDGRILGDLRKESIEFPEKPSTYWASWILVMSDRSALQRVRDALQRVNLAEWSASSPAYEAYVENWLHRPWWRGGWQGNPTPTAIQRKKISIRREHELSRILLQEHGLPAIALGHRQPICYRITRWVDRAMTRYSAFRRKRPL
jgi:hypothetical protein